MAKTSDAGKHIYCPNPYILAEIMPYGNVYPCSCAWIKNYSFGNVFEQSFDEIWNGAKAQEFREKLYNNDFSYCPGCQNLEILEEINSEEPKLISESPERILLGLDDFCDVKCVFCRDKNFVNESLIPKDKESKLLEILTPWFEKAKYVKTNAVGEVFSSKASRDLIKNIADLFPHIQFEIITNGIWATKHNLEKLNLIDRISMLTVSLHAMTEKTYNKIVSGGNFKRVMENIEYFSHLKNTGKIERLELHFTVTSLNYKEMKDIIKFARKTGAKVRFLGLDCAKNLDDIYKKINIVNPTHPQYNDFVRAVTSSEIINSKDIVLQGLEYFINLKPVSFVESLKNKFRR